MRHDHIWTQLSNATYRIELGTGMYYLYAVCWRQISRSPRALRFFEWARGWDHIQEALSADRILLAR